MTGSREKFATFESAVTDGVDFVHGVIGIIQFAEAGWASEPVTTDCVDLMVGKQREQKQLLRHHIIGSRELQKKYNGQNLLLASNDINTAAEDIPLTKSPLQKEGQLKIDQYVKLITASLKYLAMKKAGKRLKYTWEEMQSSWKLIDECLDLEWMERSFISIDYQAIDAYSVERLTACGKSKVKLERRSPTVLVIDRAYAQLELDFRQGSKLVSDIVGNYLAENWKKVDFQPGRYPLGIKQKDLLLSFAQADQQVLFSDHEIPVSENLRFVHRQSPDAVKAMLESIDQRLNGFSSTSLKVARQYMAMATKNDNDFICVVTRKPGFADIPKWKKRARALR
jgi:hypothetical protein